MHCLIDLSCMNYILQLLVSRVELPCRNCMLVLRVKNSISLVWLAKFEETCSNPKILGKFLVHAGRPILKV